MEKLKREVQYFKDSKDTLIQLNKSMTKTKTFNMLKDRMLSGDAFLVEYHEKTEAVPEVQDMVRFTCEITFREIDISNKLDIIPKKESFWDKLKRLFSIRRQK